VSLGRATQQASLRTGSSPLVGFREKAPGAVILLTHGKRFAGPLVARRGGGCSTEGGGGGFRCEKKRYTGG